MTDTTLILAGSFEQADDYAHQHGLSPRSWRYVVSARSLMGLRNVTVVRYGTWYERRDISDIENMLAVLAAHAATENP